MKTSKLNVHRIAKQTMDKSMSLLFWVQNQSSRKKFRSKL